MIWPLVYQVVLFVHVLRTWSSRLAHFLSYHSLYVLPFIVDHPPPPPYLPVSLVYADAGGRMMQIRKRSLKSQKGSKHNADETCLVKNV